MSFFASRLFFLLFFFMFKRDTYFFYMFMLCGGCESTCVCRVHIHKCVHEHGSQRLILVFFLIMLHFGSRGRDSPQMWNLWVWQVCTPTSGALGLQSATKPPAFTQVVGSPTFVLTVGWHVFLYFLSHLANPGTKKKNYTWPFLFEIFWEIFLKWSFLLSRVHRCFMNISSVPIKCAASGFCLVLPGSCLAEGSAHTVAEVVCA